MPEWILTTLDVLSRIGGICVIIAPILWVIFPKAFEAWVSQIRDARLHKDAKALESHKGDVSVKTQMSIRLFQQRRAAHDAIRAALSEVEKTILEVYLAYHRMIRDEHPHDTENNVYRQQHVHNTNAKALRLLREFRTLTQNLAGDLGHGLVETCEWASTELTLYLEPATRGGSICDPDMENQRHAGDVLRAALAAREREDAERLTA